MKVCRADSYAVMRWKNGGGSTTEIAVSPEGASLDDFDWRISMARIEQDGPFSAFSGVDRTLTLLDGPRVELRVGNRDVTLTADRPSLRFTGEDRVTASVPAGPIVDFNVMTRRLRCRHRFEQMAVAGERNLSHAGGTTILFLAEGGRLTCVDGTGRTVMLERRDSLILTHDDAGDWRLKPDMPAAVFVVALLPQD